MRVFLLWLVLAPLAGCATVSYYGQAVKGHLQITLGKRDIERVLSDPEISPQVKARLRTVQKARAFAVDELGLPDSGSYSDYVDLERDVTLWLISAAPEFSLTPRSWCYPIGGCFNYRGYFDRTLAEREAGRLVEQGWEVVLVPGLAYSTLGWFNDPVLSTMLSYSDDRLAGVLFHELAHEKLYVQDDSAFNESFATAVEQIGIRRFREYRGLPAAPAATQTFDREPFDELMLAVRGELQSLYANPPQDKAELRAEKRKIYASLAQRHAVLVDRYSGLTPYGHWFEGEGPNNARLALFSTYEGAVPEFLNLYARCDESLSCFYEKAAEMAKLPPAERRQRIAALKE
ncbi:MAG: aminopeptidase [Pseudomonadota bacterium]